jgi:hypothetical protein
MRANARANENGRRGHCKNSVQSKVRVAFLHPLHHCTLAHTTASETQPLTCSTLANPLNKLGLSDPASATFYQRGFLNQ